MVIAENGPGLHHSDNLLERAMNKYWVQNSENDKWHFIRECNNIRPYLGGSSKENVVRTIENLHLLDKPGCRVLFV